MKPGEIACRNKEVVSVQRRHFIKTYTISGHESEETGFKAINLLSGHLFS